MKANKNLLLIIALLFFTFSAFAQKEESLTTTATPQGDTISVYSDIMKRDLKVVVIVPEQYFDSESGDVVYPVVYLLHGYGGKYSDFPTRIDGIDDMASEHGVIFVCPDGQNSWYLDSPIRKDLQFETYITKELVPYIDTHYRTDANRGMRAITGLSMGGHGALWLAFRHTDLFANAGSMSGGVDITKFPTKWEISKTLGDYESNKELWADHTVMSLVPSMKNGELKVIFDCGSKDFFHEVNENLHKAMLEKGIEHDYISRPGVHNWDYWRNSLDYQLLFFDKAFEANSNTEE